MIKFPQAKLPDLNAAFVKYRNYFLYSLDSKNFSGAAEALFAINALLPQEYKVEINTVKFEDKIKQQITYQCKKCNEEISSKDIRVYDSLLPFLESVLTRTKTVKAWICPKCRNQNRLSETKMFQNQLQEPFYLKVIPSMPKQGLGISGRRHYGPKLEQWAYNFLIEIEAQIGLYRAEYEPIGSGMDESMLGDEGDD